MRASIRRSAFDQRVGAQLLDRRRGRQDRSRAPPGVAEPAHQVLVQPRQRRLFADPGAELTRRAAREGAESVQPAQVGKMLVPGLGPHRVVLKAARARGRKGGTKAPEERLTKTTLRVLVGGEDGSFRYAAELIEGTIEAYVPIMVAVDFNGDGRADLAVSTTASTCSSRASDTAIRRNCS